MPIQPFGRRSPRHQRKHSDTTAQLSVAQSFLFCRASYAKKALARKQLLYQIHYRPANKHDFLCSIARPPFPAEYFSRHLTGSGGILCQHSIWWPTKWLCSIPLISVWYFLIVNKQEAVGNPAVVHGWKIIVTITDYDMNFCPYCVHPTVILMWCLGAANTTYLVAMWFVLKTSATSARTYTVYGIFITARQSLILFLRGPMQYVLGGKLMSTKLY